jgi:hypothetical protein
MKFVDHLRATMPEDFTPEQREERLADLIFWQLVQQSKARKPRLDKLTKDFLALAHSYQRWVNIGEPRHDETTH